MEHPTSNNNISAIKQVRRLFNRIRSNLSIKETKRIRKKLYKKEAASHFFKEKEQDGTLTNRQKNVIKNIARYIKDISRHLKNLKKHLKKLNYIILQDKIMIITLLKMLECSLMNVEVIFH